MKAACPAVDSVSSLSLEPYAKFPGLYKYTPTLLDSYQVPVQSAFLGWLVDMLNTLPELSVSTDTTWKFYSSIYDVHWSIICPSVVYVLHDQSYISLFHPRSCLHWLLDLFSGLCGHEQTVPDCLSSCSVLIPVYTMSVPALCPRSTHFCLMLHVAEWEEVPSDMHYSKMVMRITSCVVTHI